MKRAFLISISILVLSVFALFFEKQTTIYQDNKVIAKRGTRVFDFVNIHGSDNPVYLIIDGKIFKGIRGSAPFYLGIPELQSILFVTQDSNQKVTFHVFNLQTRQSIDIDGQGSGFGRDIGANRKPGEAFTDYIQSSVRNKIVLVKDTGSWKEIMTLNLDSRSMEDREVK